MIKVILAGAFSVVLAANAFAAKHSSSDLTHAKRDTSCTSDATTMKLAGAALTSFMTKCERDATSSCENTAAAKKLAGAAKASFEKKCVDDSVVGSSHS